MMTKLEDHWLREPKLKAICSADECPPIGTEVFMTQEPVGCACIEWLPGGFSLIQGEFDPETGREIEHTWLAGKVTGVQATHDAEQFVIHLDPASLRECSSLT